MTVLDSPVIRRRIHRIPVDAYHRLGELGKVDGSVELIRGFIIDKMSKSGLHVFLVKAIGEFCESFVARGAAGLTVRREAPLTLETLDSEPEPDIAIVPGRDADFLNSHPKTAALVIEIAISSLEYDRAKAGIYAEAGIPEYWLVLPEEERIEVYRQPSGDLYADFAVVAAQETLASVGVEGLSMRLADFLPA